MPFIIGSGRTTGGGGSVSGDYKFTQNANNELVLSYKGIAVAMQSPDGSWFKTAVSTGVGSLHLGGGDSSDPAHSVSSIGQNCGFKSEAFNATPESAIIWFPPWQGLSADLTTEKTATFLQFGAIQTAFAPNGAVQSIGVAFDFTTTIGSNICVASITARANESYTGKIVNVIMSNPKGVELHVSSSEISVTAGQDFTVNYPSLYFARQGDQLRLSMLKEDGTPLSVRSGATNTAQPWRTLRVRPFTDMLVSAQHFGDTKQAYRTDDHSGWVRLDGRALTSLTATQQSAAASIGITGSLPNTQERVLVAASASGTFAPRTLGGSNTIARSALPNVTLSGTTDSTNTAHTHTGSSLTVSSTDTSHTHSGTTLTAATANATHSHTAGTLATNTTGSHTHTGSANGFTTVQCSSNISQGGYNVVTSPSSYTSGSAGDHTHTISGSVASDSAAHSHTITGSTGGMSANASHNHTISGNTGAMSANASHTHTFTTTSLNNNVTQTAHVPLYYSLSHFIFLGL